MPSNCNECGKDTPSKIYICLPCQNDEDFADYRTECEIWEEKMYWEDVERMLADSISDSLQEQYENDMEEYWKKTLYSPFNYASL